MKLWAFDNDGTLYDDTIAGKHFMELFHKYFAQVSGNSIDQAREEIGRLKTKWATEFSILTLVKEYGVDFAQVVNETYLRLDPVIFESSFDSKKIESIRSLPGEKIVFTNNPSAYARFVLSHLKLTSCFSDVIGMEEMGMKGKPDLSAYEVVERKFSSRPIIFCDDSLKNLDVAAQRGWITAWKKPAFAECPLGLKHVVTESIEDLFQFI